VKGQLAEGGPFGNFMLSRHGGDIALDSYNEFNERFALSGPEFCGEKAAFACLETIIWAGEPMCRHCVGLDRTTKVKANPSKGIPCGCIDLCAAAAVKSSLPLTSARCSCICAC
jgi:hypothetical protein